jgi:glucose/arabinose dehydrogenase
MNARWPLPALIFFLLCAVLVAATAARDLPVNSIKLPPGFTISIFASGVKNARSMALGTDGTLFVGTKDAGNVYAIVDRNKDGRADEVMTIAHGLNMPNGVAFRDGALT